MIIVLICVFVSPPAARRASPYDARARPGMSSTRRVAIVYGVSADPPTDRGGHGGVVRALREFELDRGVTRDESLSGSSSTSRAIADEVIVVPVYEHVYASKRARQVGEGSADYDARLAMCELAFCDKDAGGASATTSRARVVVSDVERRAASALMESASPKKARPGSTAALMEALKRESPDTDFIICVGEDAFDDLVTGKWFHGDDLLREFEFIVAPRHGYESTRREGDAQSRARRDLSVDIRGISWLDSRLTAHESGCAISSTLVRNALGRRMKDASTDDLGLPSGALHPDVLRYIVEHDLYTANEDAEGGALTSPSFADDFDSDDASSPTEASTTTTFGYFGSLTRKLAAASIEPSAYFSRDKTFQDVKDKNGLLAESRPLVGKEVDVHEAIKSMVTPTDFTALKAMPYELFDRCVRTELQNNPPGKTWTASKVEKYASATLERARVVMSWRQENKVDELLQNSILPESDCMYTHWPTYVHGRDAYGHPVVCEWPGKVNPEGLKSKMTTKEILRHRIQIMETLEYAKCANTQRAHTVYKHICIIDLENVALSAFTGEVKSFMVQLVTLLTHRYTDSLHLMYLVNTPVVFRVIFAVFAPLMSTTTKSKIFMFGAGPNQSRKLAKQLVKHGISVEDAPPCAGGTNEGVRMDEYIRQTIELRARLLEVK